MKIKNKTDAIQICTPYWRCQSGCDTPEPWTLTDNMKVFAIKILNTKDSIYS